MLPGISSIMEGVVGLSETTILNITPAVSGKTTWDLAVDGDLVLTTSTDYDITVNGKLTCNVYMWGGGGGDALTDGGGGGGGGYVTGTTSLILGNTYRCLVAGGGKSAIEPGIGGDGGYGGGGGGGGVNAVPYAQPGTSYGTGGAGGADPGGAGPAGGGGGCSALFNSTTKINANAILVAAGGGGGSFKQLGLESGIPGGGLTAATGTADEDGKPGTQVSGGAAGTPAPEGATAGGAGYGGAGNDASGRGSGGGGGAGWYGGGGGGNDNIVPGAVGGGGSSYWSSNVTNGATIAGSGRLPGGNTTTKYPGSNIGYGGIGTTHGYSGAIVFSLT